MPERQEPRTGEPRRFPEPKQNPGPISIGNPIQVGPMAPGIPIFHKGVDVVPHTGPAILEKGEKVIPKEQNMDNMSSIKDILGSKETHKPKKVIKAIHTRKVKGHGGHTSYVHEHHHTHPEHHPMEEHSSANQDEMVSHMMDHMGEPNPGEQEANAGQSGVPEQGAPAGPVPGM
jgi:hypothetical protein